MDQVKKYLERYVEWLALALGVAFLLWTVYGYVYSKPVHVTVASEDVGPGQISTLIWEKGKTLKAAVDGTDVPKMPAVADVVRDVHSSLEVPQPYAMAAPFSPLAQAVTGGPGIEAPTPVAQGNLVTKLEPAPAIVDLKVSGGHSNVPAPLPAGQVADANALAPAAGKPVMAVDKSWRTISGRIPVAELDKAFKASKIPTKLYSTAVLKVVLVRQEQNAAGEWGPTDGTEIPSLSINPMTTLPAINAPAAQQKDYQDWAEKNAAMIMQPAFYKVLQGDAWYVPGTKNPNEVQVQMVAFDPSTFKGDPSTLSPEDKKAFEAFKIKQRQDALNARRAAQPRNPNTPPASPTNPAGGGTTRPPGGRAGRTNGLADDPERRAAEERGGAGLDAMPVPGGMTDRQRPVGTDDTSAAATDAAATLPQGSFDPSAKAAAAGTADIIVWAHDDSVQAGKTYRYKLKYMVSNPVARSVGLCDPQSLANQFYIPSVDSVWSAPVSVEADTNFYAVKVNPSRSEVTFDVFHWKDGLWQLQTVKVTPGDMVGGVDPGITKTDFATGWTLVDVRSDPRDESVTIMLVSDNGTLLKRDPNTDMRNNVYHKLLDQVKVQHEKDPKTAAAQ